MGELLGVFQYDYFGENDRVIKVYRFQWTHDVTIMSLLRQNDVAASFWRNNDVIITVCVHWGCTFTDVPFNKLELHRNNSESTLHIDFSPWFANSQVFFQYTRSHGWPPTQPGSLHTALQRKYTQPCTALQRKYTQPCSLFSRGTAVWTMGARLCEQWGTAVCKCPAV